MVLTELQVTQNKEKFIELLKTHITRQGANVEALIQKLESSDFFEAPCSTKYHLNCKGGLCQHSLNVYYKLKEFVKLYNLENVITEEMIAIVALLHDISKMDYYKLCQKPLKVYCEDGDKRDNGGKFKWETQEYYQVIDAEERFVFGHHGQNSLYLIEYYVPLMTEEAAAVNNHMGCVFDEYRPWDATPIFNRYPLASLLHMADFAATYICENDRLIGQKG